jgi:acyl carrier protein
MDILSDLNKVFREVFNNPEINISVETTSNDIIGWDSFSHINLITAIEIYFDIEFTQTEAVSFSKVGDMIQSIKNKVSGKNG